MGHINVKQIHKLLCQYHFLFRYFCSLIKIIPQTGFKCIVCIVNIQHFWFVINVIYRNLVSVFTEPVPHPKPLGQLSKSDWD
jgi:hypothetical protein